MGVQSWIIKCRRPTCSHQCYANWAQKHAACVAKLLKDSVTEPHYRGNLTLAGGSTPADHKRVRKEFLRIIRRWATKHAYTFEAHGVLHITDPINAHWDVVAYSDAPKTTLRRVVSDAWSRAGGLRQSLVPLDPDELDAVTRYQVKEAPKKGRVYLPAEQSVSGLNLHWSTAGFWRGKSVDQLWAELIQEWFHADDADDQGDDVESESVSNNRLTSLEPTDTIICTPQTILLAEIQRQLERLDAIESEALSTALKRPPQSPIPES
jgi:hypothetical protein